MDSEDRKAMRAAIATAVLVGIGAAPVGHYQDGSPVENHNIITAQQMRARAEYAVAQADALIAALAI